jgi:hypothetical protein
VTKVQQEIKVLLVRKDSPALKVFLVTKGQQEIKALLVRKEKWETKVYLEKKVKLVRKVKQGTWAYKDKGVNRN